MYSVARILEMMALTGHRLGEIEGELPKLFRAKRNINCSWEHKGKVMRRIMKDSDQHRRDLVDGVKIYFNGGSNNSASVLLIPDKERPMFHINAKAMTEKAADEIASEYEKKVIRWRDEL